MPTVNHFILHPIVDRHATPDAEVGNGGALNDGADPSPSAKQPADSLGMAASGNTRYEIGVQTDFTSV